jgi:hypothetical protein
MRHRSTLAGAVVVLALAFPWAGGLAFVLQEAAAAGGGCCNGRQWHGPAGQGQGQATRVRARARQQGIVCSASPKPARTTIPTDAPLVGDPQLAPLEKEYSIDAILKELAEIQRQGPKNYCILGTRHCSFLHQQIIELLAFALVLSGNHVFTSGAGGTNAATIRGALRAERPDLLTVVLPQSFSKQNPASQDLLKQVSFHLRNSLSFGKSAKWCMKLNSVRYFLPFIG